MAGLVPAISFREARCSRDRERRDKPGDDVCGRIDLIGTCSSVNKSFVVNKSLLRNQKQISVSLRPRLPFRYGVQPMAVLAHLQIDRLARPVHGAQGLVLGKGVPRAE
jgi:hypothetical protein